MLCFNTTKIILFRYEDYIVSVIIKSQRFSQVSLELEEVFYRSSKMQIYLYDQSKQKKRDQKQPESTLSHSNKSSSWAVLRACSAF